jgi:hypothetical protein
MLLPLMHNSLLIKDLNFSDSTIPQIESNTKNSDPNFLNESATKRKLIAL